MIQQEGDGWRVSHDPSRGEFCVLIGGERWAFELTEPEWRDLVDLVATLEQQHRGLVDQLMPEESIELELDRGVWWGCLSGDRSQWELRILLTPAGTCGAGGVAGPSGGGGRSGLENVVGLAALINPANRF